MLSISFILLGLIVLYAILGIFLYIFQEKLLFQSKTLDKNYSYNFDFEFEERFDEMEDGAVINSIFIPSGSSKGVILYFHGNSGNLTKWGKIGHYFTRYGYDVFICDYRGYGKSTGKRNMNNLFDDAKTLYNILLKNYREKDIIIYGRSIGSGMACRLASETDPKRLILETPFYSINHISFFRYLLLPVDIILRYPFPNYKYIKSVKSPIHIFHGTTDGVVPYFSGKKLFECISEGKDAELITINSGKHNNLMKYDYFDRKMKNILA